MTAKATIGVKITMRIVVCANAVARMLTKNGNGRSIDAESFPIRIAALKFQLMRLS